MNKTFIYGLKLVGDDIIRYIGKADDPDKRLKKHISNTKLSLKHNVNLTHKDRWLIKHNFNVTYVILEECDYNIWSVREQFYINLYDNLTNTTDGGLGGGIVKYKLSYGDVKKIVKPLNITSKIKWLEYKKTNKLPDGVPNDPSTVYKNKGWENWVDWLGKEK